ncbi:MAG: Carboxypeptidase regulatory-like protein [Acidobacteriota bacterium]|nr:Carboxypeptidase regulatory-like protein [Acidobacteriota bacterium]
MKTKNINIINVIVCVVVFGGLFLGFTTGMQAKLISVGILAFHDESGTGVPGELGPRISRDLQQKLVKSYPDLIPRIIGTEMNTAAVTGMTVQQLAAYGKEQGIDFLVRGGLLAISCANTNTGVQVNVELYAEIISSETNIVKSVRASGVGDQGVIYPSSQVPWEAIDIPGGEFQKSAPGLAILNAVEQLAGSIHEAVAAPTQESEKTEAAIAQETPIATEGAQQTQEATPETNAAVDEEDLQQLISQAEQLTYNSTISSEKLTTLSQALEKLKTSLNTKASLMEQGQDSSGIDQDIYQQKEQLRLIITQVTEEVSSSQQTTQSAQDSQAVTGEKKNLLASIGSYLDDSLNILQKIQELRSTLKGDSGSAQGEEAAAADAAAEPGADTVPAADSASTVEEESTEEVSGVVTEEDKPVEGVTVTDPESGATATTDSSGFYNLGKIPAGRLTELVVSKGGKKLALGKVDMVSGRSTVADWELKPKFSLSKTPVLRVMPSLVNVSAGKPGVVIVGTGTIKGVVLDINGKPMPRVLVKLGNMGAVRTNSRGEYVFLRVPPGNHMLTVMRSVYNNKSQPVSVGPRASIVQTIRFSPQDIIKKQPVFPPFIVHGTATDLWGKVIDEKNRPIAYAKVTIMKGWRAISASTLTSGKYLFKDLQPGTYRVLVSKPGFKTSSCDITLKPGKTEKLFFKLEGPPPHIRKIWERHHPKVKPVIVKPAPRRPGKTVVIAPPPPPVVRPAPIINGRMAGRVITSGTGKPIAGATISIAGRGSVTSGPSGGYTFSNLAPGTYQVSVSKTGFLGTSRTITIKSGQTVTVDFALPLKVIILRKK